MDASAFEPFKARLDGGLNNLVWKEKYPWPLLEGWNKVFFKAPFQPKFLNPYNSRNYKVLKTESKARHLLRDEAQISTILPAAPKETQSLKPPLSPY